jgi:Antibiotic biosynthesis monooxygenase
MADEQAAGSNPATEPVHLVVVWRADPSVQSGVVEVIEQTLKEVTSKLPGFREARVFKSANGTEVLMDIEWDSVEHAQQIEGVPEVGRVSRSLGAVTHRDRNIYRLVERVEA